MFDDPWLNSSFIAAWDLYNQNKSEVSWDLVTINPTYVSRFVQVSSLLHVTHYFFTIWTGFWCKIVYLQLHIFLNVFDSPQFTTSSPLHPWASLSTYGTMLWSRTRRKPKRRFRSLSTMLMSVIQLYPMSSHWKRRKLEARELSAQPVSCFSTQTRKKHV